MSIGERIQELRKRNLMSQEEMAEQLDVSKQSVSKWELDKAVPNVEKIIRMCEQFGVTCDFLLLGKEEEKEAKPELRQEDENMQKPFLKESGEGRKLAGVYSILLCISLVAACAALVLFGRIAVYYSGFAGATKQQAVCVERIYSQYTVADVMYTKDDGAFVTKKVYLDNKGIHEGDWIFGEVSESGRLSFPYDTGRLAVYAGTALFFFVAALFFSIRIYRMREQSKEQC